MLARARTPSSTKSLREFGFRCICLLRTAVALLLPPRATCVACTLWCDSLPTCVALDPPRRVVVVVVVVATAAVVVLLLLLLLCRYGTVRSFNLEHHTILYPQTPAASVWSFTAAALEGALTGALHAFRVLLVGPAGAQTHLERAALRLDDVRLRPAVVHNFLLLLHQLHGHHGEPPATFAQVAELLARVSPEERLRRCLQRVVVDTSKDINEARRRSDVAGVRAHAQTAAQRRQAGGGASRTCNSHVGGDGDSDDDHDDAADDDDGDHGDVAGVRAQTAAQRRQAGGGASRTNDSHVGGGGDGDSDDDHDHDDAAAADDDHDHGGPSVVRTGCVGVFGNYDVGMDTVFAALEEAVAHDEARAEQRRNGAVPPPLEVRRGEDALNDYDGAAEATYDAFWHIFPLRQGLRAMVPVTTQVWRRVFLHASCRPAHSELLLVHAADCLMRHSVNSGVSARVRADEGSFQKFRETFGNLREALRTARADVDSEESQLLLDKVLKYLTLCNRCAFSFCWWCLCRCLSLFLFFLHA